MILMITDCGSRASSPSSRAEDGGRDDESCPKSRWKSDRPLGRQRRLAACWKRVGCSTRRIEFQYWSNILTWEIFSTCSGILIPFHRIRIAWIGQRARCPGGWCSRAAAPASSPPRVRCDLCARHRIAGFALLSVICYLEVSLSAICYLLLPDNTLYLIGRLGITCFCYICYDDCACLVNAGASAWPGLTSSINYNRSSNECRNTSLKNQRGVFLVEAACLQPLQALSAYNCHTPPHILLATIWSIPSISGPMRSARYQA